jgi:dolichol kinase
MPMQLCSLVYLIFLTLDLIQSLTQQHINQEAFSTTAIGIAHLLLVSCHPGSLSPSRNIKEQYASWQNAFSPGEWMVVSTVITAILGEYFLDYVFHMRTNNFPYHFVVAHSGLTGCILGVMGVTFIQKMVGDLAHYLSGLPSLILIMSTTIGCLEVALKETTLRKIVTIPAFSLFGLPFCEEWVPRSIQWLVAFLTSAPNFDGAAMTDTFSFRVTILFYWVAILALCLPVSTVVASWAANSAKDADAYSSQMPPNVRIHTTFIQSAKKKRRVVIARKYFHLVALILFVPITRLDSDMMSLSYAIATSLMLVLEMMRCLVPESDIIRKETGGSASGISTLNQFYNLFFDEKDAFAKRGGIVVSHITLVFGCACPLWVYQLMQYHTNAKKLLKQAQLECISAAWQLISVMPYIGVITLGVGDSAGAVGGLSMTSPTRWPGGSSRTLGGSFCMLLSMTFAASSYAFMVGLEPVHYTRRIVLLLLVSTLVEASTKQIDNLCLPLTGTTFLILMATLESENITKIPYE